MTELVKYETRGLRFTRKPENLDEVGAILQGLMEFGNKLPWSVGDLIIYAQEVFGEAAAQLVPEKSAKTVTNWTAVCSRIPIQERVYDLTFSHYTEAAYLIHERRNALLAKAEQEGWTVSQLRVAIKGPKAEKPLLECPHCHARLEIHAGIAQVRVLPSGEVPDIGERNEGS